jgi:hypothetical protein
MLALTRLEVSVATQHPNIMQSTMNYTNYDRAAVVAAFNEMNARGVLVVQHERGMSVFIVCLFRVSLLQFYSVFA